MTPPSSTRFRAPLENRSDADTSPYEWGGRGYATLASHSVLGAFHVAAILGVDHQLGADPDMRRHHHPDAAFDHGGLVGRRSGLAPYHGVGLDDGQHHALGQLDADRCAFIERNLDFHAVLRPA